MSKIKIRNFGPIKAGYKEKEGWMDIKKVTVFIGNQGSGKSTVAKVISTLTWMEKALSRGDIQEKNLLTDELYEHFEYQRIEKYFKPETLIEYQGEFAHITIKNDIRDCMVDIKEKRQLSVLPKIMYVPAERNFLTVVKNAYDVTNIPATLKTFGEELKKSMFSLNGKMLELPIGNDKIKYDKSKDKIFLVLNDLDLEISDSSSGYQSLVPLYAVTKYLCDEINKNRGELPIKLSINQSLRRQEQLDSINSDLSLSNEVKQERIRDINKKFFPSCLVNIVEEPEQNLFPNSQQQILNSLLEFNNMNSENKLIITTHSPYLINYLTLAVKAEMVKLKLNTNSSKKKLAEIVPLDATLCAENLVIYELNEKDGTIKKLSDYKGLPSDKNYLNSGLEDLNELFAQLQEIEKGWR